MTEAKINIAHINSWTDLEKKKIKWIFTDVDDTLTFDGQLLAETMQALWQLKNQGIKVVAVTGACAGWCDQMAKLWPLYAVIGENGAVWMQKTATGFSQSCVTDAKTMKVQQQELMSKINQLLKSFPGVSLAQDQVYRCCDVAIDIGQERPKLDDDTCQQLLEQVRKLTVAGHKVNATLSSIHINAWIGDHSKRHTSETFLREHDPHIHLDEVMYIGDSLNDESMFEWLTTTVGVANIQPYLSQLTSLPSYITSHAGGKGFAEMAEYIVMAYRKDIR